MIYNCIFLHLQVGKIQILASNIVSVQGMVEYLPRYEPMAIILTVLKVVAHP